MLSFMKQILTFVCVDTISWCRIRFGIGLRSWNYLKLYLVLLGHSVVWHGDSFFRKRLVKVILWSCACAVWCFWVLIVEVLLSVILSHIALILHIFYQACCPLFGCRRGLYKPSTTVREIQEILQDRIVVKLDLRLTQYLLIRISIIKGSKFFVKLSSWNCELIVLVYLLSLIEVYTASLFNSDLKLIWTVLIILNHVVPLFIMHIWKVKS